MSINLKCASFFAGVGGIDYAFKNVGFTTIYANEIDEYAIITYEQNFNLKVESRSICEVSTKEIPNFDIMIAGFPCQSFSVAGKGKGFADEKNGKLFFELERIFKEKRPKVIFLENVKNLLTHDKGNTFKLMFKKLEDAGYNVKYEVLNGATHGNIPQNRERIYIVAFLDELSYYSFQFPISIPLTKKVSDLIMFNEKVSDCYYYTEAKCKFFGQLEKGMVDNNSIYQWRRSYVRENKNKVCPTLTANMGTGGNNVPIVLAKHGIRKLTPRECFNLQGFPKEFILLELSNTRLYKQAGNSVVVPVVERIAEAIKEILEMYE